MKKKPIVFKVFQFGALLFVIFAGLISIIGSGGGGDGNTSAARITSTILFYADPACPFADPWDIINNCLIAANKSAVAGGFEYYTEMNVSNPALNLNIIHIRVIRPSDAANVFEADLPINWAGPQSDPVFLYWSVILDAATVQCDLYLVDQWLIDTGGGTTPIFTDQWNINSNCQ